MDSITIIKIIVFVGCIIGSRVVLRRVPKHLTERQLELLAEKSKTVNLLRNVLVYGAAISLFVFGRIAPNSIETIQIYLLAILVIGMFLVILLSCRIFNKLSLPSKARNAYILSVAIFIGGLIFILLPIG
jgi:membrane-bound acyltransferase YfiQ involved in biofilm formation